MARRRFIPLFLLAGATVLLVVGAVIATVFLVQQFSHQGAGKPVIKHVFLIMMENSNWTGTDQALKGSPDAPYINNVLLPMASSANQYYTPPNIHPSLPNYLWLEAGTNFGVFDDKVPAAHHQQTSDHFVSLLSKAGYTWKAYLEGISGQNCPVVAGKDYVPRHDGPLYFDDVTDGNSRTSPTCISHTRPMSELADDLQNNTVPNFSYITPNLCDDMHRAPDCSGNTIQAGDIWLSRMVPQIMQSQAYKESGAIFIVWDEGGHTSGGASDGPIPFLLISPYARHGYSNDIHYDHSSTLRTFEELFGLTPLLGEAAHANDLRDFFTVSLT
jgi:phosphatidylinositol-3-phosphatase